MSTTLLNSEMYDIWQDKYLQDVETFSTHRDFLICFEVSFMQKNKDGGLDVPKEVARKIYRFHRPVTDILVDFVHPGRNHEIYVDISNMLSMMDVPPHAHNWIGNGLRFCATNIAKESENRNRKTISLRLMVWVAKDDKRIDMIAKVNLGNVMRSRVEDRCKAGEEEEEVCSICLKPLLLMLKENSNIINIEGAVRLSACDHMFHKTCITKWFLESSTCPYCRTCCRSDRDDCISRLIIRKTQLENRIRINKARVLVAEIRSVLIIKRAKKLDCCCCCEAAGEEEEEEEKVVCSICLEALVLKNTFEGYIRGVEEEAAVELQACNHMFHQTCITKWFHQSSTCPYCRTSCRTYRPIYCLDRHFLSGLIILKAMLENHIIELQSL